MNVLVACECSGRVKTAFRNKGHNAWSCDILPSEIENDPYHIQDDVLKHLNDGWDLMVAHPPCTRLSMTSYQWIKKDDIKYGEMLEAARFFNALDNANINKKALENPLQHPMARNLIRRYDQIIQPLWFGETARKTTCLWLTNLPPLMATVIMQEERIKSGSGREWGKWFWDTSCIPYKDRGKERSRTFQGIANAMAEQWG